MALGLVGEVTLPRPGGDLTLLFDIYALAMAEQELKLNSMQIVTQMAGRWRLHFTGVLLWAALREHHPEFDVKASIRLLQVVTAAVAEEKLSESMKLCFPAPAEEANAEPGPQTAEAAGIG